MSGKLFRITCNERAPREDELMLLTSAIRRMTAPSCDFGKQALSPDGGYCTIHCLGNKSM